MRHIAPDRCFTGAGVNDVGVRRRHRQRADRGGIEIAVGDISPVLTAVGRLPDTTGTGPEIKGHGIRRIARDRHHAPAAMRSDAAKFQIIKQLPLYDLRGVCRGLIHFLHLPL